jgi:hypothetical protein
MPFLRISSFSENTLPAITATLGTRRACEAIDALLVPSKLASFLLDPAVVARLVVSPNGPRVIHGWTCRCC